jgi:hypothetical protein
MPARPLLSARVAGLLVGVAACGGRVATVVSAGAVAPRLASICAATTVDADHDGLDDACEAALAEAFAPVVIHSNLEAALPTDVDDFLAKTSLAVKDDTCPAGAAPVAVRAAPTQAELLGHTQSTCGGAPITSDGTRSDGKHRSFFLANVAKDDRIGTWDTRRWTTYVHAFPADQGGINLQYWRVYTWNYALADHGGDWEGIHVQLNRDHGVVRVGFLGHRRIDWEDPSDVEWDGAHPVVYSEIGGHTSRPSPGRIAARGCVGQEACVVSLDDLATHYRQETWTGGRVVWPDGRVTAGGGLVNVGEKSAPLHGQVFIRYSGLWGSPGRLYATSGYWGPAYNETHMRDDGFMTAWCAGIAPPLNPEVECFAATAD